MGYGPMGPPRQATGPPRQGAGAGVGMLRDRKRYQLAETNIN